MLSSEYLSMSLRTATVVVPVAVYFLILGLLNSRRRPQLLTGRADFAILVAALSPLFVLPALNYVGISLLTVSAAAAVLTAVILLLLPRGMVWVIYNISPQQARGAVERALRSIGIDSVRSEKGLQLGGGGGFVTISDFPLLRNVTIRLRGCGEEMAGRFAAALPQTLAPVRAETSPTAVALLLVATAMIVAPLAMMVHRVPEIVRLLNDLLN